MTTMQPWILPAAGLAVTVLNWVLAHLHKHTMTDTERAALLRELAEGAAAVVSAAWPNKPWSELVNLIVQRLLNAPGVPTRSQAALEQAATAALLKLGRTPNVR